MFYVSRFQGIEKREYVCEVVTPLFLGGADPRNVELRIPPIKAAMRYWWRACNPMNCQDLYIQESSIFGDAGHKFGKCKMTITLHDIEVRKGEYQPLPHQTQKPKNFRNPCILPESRFRLLINGTEEHHQIFRLFILLSGVGKRSRRGFGSIKISTIDGKPSEEACNLEIIIKLLNRIGNNAFSVRNGKIERLQIDNVKYAYIRSIQIGKYQTIFSELLKVIGQASHKYDSVFTGFVRNRERQASPVYVTVNRIDNVYIPVVTVLNMAFKKEEYGPDKSNDFINAVMQQGGAT